VPAKDRDKRRATWNAWYHRTKHLKKDQVARKSAVKLARLRSLTAWIAELKTELRCRDCGIDHPGCLVFHHTDPATKDLTVADAVRRGFSRARIQHEIAKCVVLCANCHIMLHHRERARAP
jgi:serine acetyltransferase